MIVTELFDYEGPLDSAKLIVDTRNAMKVFTPRRSSGSSVLTVSMHRISKVARRSPPNKPQRHVQTMGSGGREGQPGVSGSVSCGEPSSRTFGVATCNKYEMCAATIIRLHGA